MRNPTWRSSRSRERRCARWRRPMWAASPKASRSAPTGNTSTWGTSSRATSTSCGVKVIRSPKSATSRYRDIRPRCAGARLEATLVVRPRLVSILWGGPPERGHRASSSNPNTVPARLTQTTSSMEALMREPNALISTDALARELGGDNLRVFDCTTYLEPPPPGSDDPYIAVPGRSSFEMAHIPGGDFLDIQGEFSDNATRLRFIMPPVAQH